MQPSMELEQTVAQLHADQIEIRRDLNKCLKFITGNGDPTKGLLWLAADLGRLVASQSDMLAAQRLELKDHEKKGHAPVRTWTIFAYDVGKSIAIWAAIAFLIFVTGHVRVTVGTP